MSNDLEKMETKKTLILNIRKRELNFLGHIIRKVGLENLILTGQIGSKRDRGKQRITYLASLSKWFVEQGLSEITKKQTLLRAKKERKLW